MTYDNKKIKVYRAEGAGLPVVYSNDHEESGERLLKRCREFSCPAFHLVCVCGLDWDADMSPWPSEPVVYRNDNFSGKGPEYLQQLLHDAVPHVKEILQEEPERSYIAGYSMAGLFALWSLYETDFFRGAACVSGSLWFPGFLDFALNTEMKGVSDGIYLSLGDRESAGRNPVLKRNEGVYRSLEACYHEKGIRSVFELNAGGHFTDIDIRTAKGITWLLRQQT